MKNERLKESERRSEALENEKEKGNKHFLMKLQEIDEMKGRINGGYEAEEIRKQMESLKKINMVYISLYIHIQLLYNVSMVVVKGGDC